VQAIKERYNLTPVEHLADLEILTPNLLACHCVALTKSDIALLGRFDVKVAHNAESNMKLASGIAPIPELLEAGICVGIGTDGCASNNNLDIFQEMDTVAKLHKAKTLDPTVLDAYSVLRMATIQGARALGLGDIIGSLKPNKNADLIVIDTHKPHLTPLYNPTSHLVYAARGSDVTTSIINGRIVMENGRILSFDIEKAMDDVNQIAAELG
ncbi:MAG: amidohydrolase family protein, partial [Desulfobacterales bacterium]|jgi:5-methylthioadenosine/S-adenosylhomocysteine deaminase